MPMSTNFQDYILFNYGAKRFAKSILQNRFIINNPFYNYFYTRKMLKDMSRYQEIPRHIRIENTNICNADCTICPHKNMKRAQGNMSMDLFKKIIDEATRLNPQPSIGIHGFGEPLLDKLFFERIVYAKKRGIKSLSSNTNASFLNSENIDRMLKSGLDEIYISFDAAKAETYAKIRKGLNFEEIENNIKHFVSLRNERAQKKPKIYLSFVECGFNAGEIKVYIRKWKNLVDGISVSLMHNWAGYHADKMPNYFVRYPSKLFA
jgi:MoaA/NifB/PqqE/SkfB family radical SAM enzyme